MFSLILSLACLASLSAQGGHTHPSLLVGAEEAKPGTTVLAGVKLQMDLQWHTYWKNPGLGTPTKVDWQLPKGVTAGEVQWPIPEKLIDQDISTYIYSGTAILLIPLKLAADLPPGPLQLKADVTWLECNVQCIPGQATVDASLTIGQTEKPSKDAALLESWKTRLPLPSPPPGARASWEKPATGDLRPLLLEWQSPGAVTNADFFPLASDDFEVQGPVQKLEAAGGIVRIRKEIKKLAGDWPKQVSGVLVEQSGAQPRGYEATLAIGQGGAAEASPAPAGGSAEATTTPRGLWQMLVYAFIGGLILNVMPCVLPVLALKVLGFVAQGRDDPRRARKLGLIYGLGVLVSFLALALVVIVVRASWGFQFGNPYFLVVMTVLVTLIALNLFGVFEVRLGGRAMDAAAKLSSRHGASGAFFNGLLATLLATSCTAPFLGAAVGFASVQPPLIVLLVLGTVGVGLAAPYVVLSWQPGWLKFLPKPGAWMERFKILMGFPMLAAAVWLFSLAALHYGDRAYWLAIFLVFVGLAAWVHGEFVQRQGSRPGLALGAVVAIFAVGYAFALESHLRWRAPLPPGSSVVTQNDPGGIPWQPWSSSAVAEARAQGRLALVDFTAKWCLTCNTIVKPALESATVKDKVRQLNVATFLGDYTGFAPEIRSELKRYGKDGVPLVIVFPKKSDAPAIVLPEAMTPGMVVNALEKAATL